MTLRTPWEDDPAAVDSSWRPDAPAPPAKPRGRRPAAVASPATETAPTWLYHHLTISGPAETVAAFAAAARGAGGSEIEEDVFNLAVSPPAGRRSLTIDGCRILARQFRERAEARQARAAALVGRSLACPFDLQALLPVPPAILRLGPSHPDALAWLAAQWGTTDRLRQVAGRPKPTTGRRLPKSRAVIGYGFFTASETPRAAIGQLGAAWPALRLVLQPRPAD